MNINLSTGIGDHPMEPDDCNFEGDIEEHKQIMENAGYNLTGNTCLLSQPDTDGNNYPGSYQVWLQVEDGPWVYVDPDGNAEEQFNPLRPTE